VKVRLYRLDRKTINETELVQRAVAQPKNTLVLLDQQAVDAKASRLIAEVDTNEKGGFSFLLGDRQKYAGEAFEIDVYCGTVPHRKPGGKTPAPRQFSITTLQPQWRETDQGFLGGFDYCIPYRFWCDFRRLFGAWVICGDVDLCANNQPLGGVRVFAYDVQFIHDAPLGSAVTDGSGKFRIDYTPADFETALFSTLEYELFASGPDVYFRIETLSGTPLLVEPRSRAHSPDRDAGPCLCVELCVDKIPQRPPVTVLSAFTSLGVYNFTTDIDSALLGTGLTLGDGRAFFSTVRLNGVLAQQLNGQPLEYMFETKDLSGGGYVQAPVAQIGATKIGVLEKYAPAFVGDPNPVKTFPYMANSAPAPGIFVTSFTPDGWIKVPQENDVFGIGNFVANGDMILLKTPLLSPFPHDDVTGLLASQNATTVGPLVQNKYFGIRMWVREAGNPASAIVAGECFKVAINNTLYDNVSHHPSWAGYNVSGALAVNLVDIAELIGMGCKELTNSLTVLFTAVHPTLGSVTINMQGPGGPYNFILPPAVAGQQFGTAAPDGWTFNNLIKCAYLVTLSVQVLLTTGDSAPGNLIDQIAFCKH
jgi:hypothetical protein